MKVLIVGSAGREHALAWKIKQSPKVEHIYIAPGNGGTAQVGENVPLNTKDNKEIVAFALSKSIDLAVVQMDDQLAQGAVDALTAAGIKTFGPTKEAAKIEWSKASAKDFMKAHNIPTAEYYSCTDLQEAIHKSTEMVRTKGKSVIKGDGLQQGKGVVIAETEMAADEACRSLIDFHKTLVVEEFLEGQEISIHAFCDGTNAKLFPASRDHKRIYDGNRGPNTGGMGTIAPVVVPEGFLDTVKEAIVMPVLNGLKFAGNPFVGVLYPGLMLTKDGPKVLEYNARFGDPETESYMRLLETDLVDIMESCIAGTLDKQEVTWSPQHAITVMLAPQGYPGIYEKGFAVETREAEESADVVVFHKETILKDGLVVTNGGRVLGVSATGATQAEARKKVYEAVEKVSFQGKYYRTDIGLQ